MDNNLLPKPTKCAVSCATERLQYHCEDYYHPWTAVALAQPIHLALHRRFTHPAEWLAIVDRYSVSGDEWFASLSLQPIDVASYLRTVHSDAVRDVFANINEL